MQLTEKEKVLINKLSEIEDFTKHFETLKAEITAISILAKDRFKEAKDVENNIEKIIQEKSIGFPWISEVIAEYFEARDLKIAEFLDKKLRPAASTADRVRELAKEKRLLKKEFLIARNFVNYYETLFPWLQDFVNENLDELILQVHESETSGTEEIDPVRNYLTQGEFEKLSTPERNQKALERYWQRRKSSWEVGRDYERYVGYCYELKGFKVYYQGIEMGLADMGRDLICTDGKKTEIVQCKYWSKEKKINEKHINQLFGTTVKYLIDKKVEIDTPSQLTLFSDLSKFINVSATFMTTTELTETARDFAKTLGIKVIESDIFNHDYPCIKCNISRASGEKIYHLPFDQQYDTTVIDLKRGELYVKDTFEAEKRGFRRAWKWRGDNIE